MFPSSGHDHERCRSAALRTAAALCSGRGARLTPIRRRVLEIVWGSHTAIGAYQVMDALREDHGAVTPPTVYRALDFLMAQGLVHRVASLNAYIGCSRPAEGHPGQFLICRGCHQTLEVDDKQPAEAVEAIARRQGFTVERSEIEVHGLCASCRKGAGRA